MKSLAKTQALLVDIGGVLLTGGWQTASRKLAAKAFRLDLNEMEERHHTVSDTYEEGKLTLEEYPDWVVFYKKRSFTRAQFRKFMFAQSKPYPEMIELLRRLKATHGLKIIVLSNEARELNAYRIHQFKLGEFLNAFVSSCYVRLRKPDPDIFRLAMDIAQTPAQQIVYIENTAMFIQIAESMGIQGILHKNCRFTDVQLAKLGSKSAGGVTPPERP